MAWCLYRLLGQICKKGPKRGQKWPFSSRNTVFLPFWRSNLRGYFQVLANFQLIYSTFWASARQKVVLLGSLLKALCRKCPLNQLKIGRVLKMTPQNPVPRGSKEVIWGQNRLFWPFLGVLIWVDVQKGSKSSLFLTRESNLGSKRGLKKGSKRVILTLFWVRFGQVTGAKRPLLGKRALNWLFYSCLKGSLERFVHFEREIHSLL